jgi:copper chaperone CopZ
MYWLTLLILPLVWSGCSQPPTEPADISVEDATPAVFNSAELPTIEFAVPDMMCAEGCGVAVEGILAKQPGAKEVFVDFDAKTAKVAIDEGKFDSDKALAALVDKQFLNSSLKDGVAAKPSLDRELGAERQAADAAVQ